MNQKIFNFLVFCNTILIVNLITTFITDYFMGFKNQTDTFKFTAIGMGVIVLIFYPFFQYINRFTERFTAKLLKKGKNYFGRLFGVYLVFCILLFIIYCIYAYIWFRVNVPMVLLERVF